jgi:hypothetical protein
VLPFIKLHLQIELYKLPKPSPPGIYFHMYKEDNKKNFIMPAVGVKEPALHGQQMRKYFL